MAPTTVAIDIYRNVEGDISPYNFNGSPAFKLKKGFYSDTGYRFRRNNFEHADHWYPGRTA